MADASAPSASMAGPSTATGRVGGPSARSTSSTPPVSQSDPLLGHAKYKKVQDLSSGSFGFVQLACNAHANASDVIAIKFIERGERVNRYVEAEILNHRMLRHPHVVEFKEVFLTPEYICIAMEYASGGNLFGYVQRAGRLKEPAARWFFQQLIIGLDYCHRRGVVNRDIKLENTLLQMVPGLPLPLIKICDFGYSKAHFMSAPKSKVGTLAYMAPEVIKTTGNYNGNLADIWSCGVMLYVMLFGQYPFDATVAAVAVNGAAAAAAGGERRVQQMMNRILSMQWAIPNNVEISPECKELLGNLLVADPNKRLTMEQIQASPWFTRNLPTDALLMNDNFLEHTDYTGVQTVEDIQAILQTAQTPGPGRHNFNTEEEDFDLIDDAIQDDLFAHNSSFDLSRLTPAQARAAGVAGAAAAALQQHRMSTVSHPTAAPQQQQQQHQQHPQQQTQQHQAQQQQQHQVQQQQYQPQQQQQQHVQALGGSPGLAVEPPRSHSLGATVGGSASPELGAPIHGHLSAALPPALQLLTSEHQPLA